MPAPDRSPHNPLLWYHKAPPSSRRHSPFSDGPGSSRTITLPRINVKEPPQGLFSGWRFEPRPQNSGGADWQQVTTSLQPATVTHKVDSAPKVWLIQGFPTQSASLNWIEPNDIELNWIELNKLHWFAKGEKSCCHRINRYKPRLQQGQCDQKQREFHWSHLQGKKPNQEKVPPHFQSTPDEGLPTRTLHDERKGREGSGDSKTMAANHSALWQVASNRVTGVSSRTRSVSVQRHLQDSVELRQFRPDVKVWNVHSVSLSLPTALRRRCLTQAAVVHLQSVRTRQFQPRPMSEFWRRRCLTNVEFVSVDSAHVK